MHTYSEGCVAIVARDYSSFLSDAQIPVLEGVRVDEIPSRMMRRKMHLAAGELQVDSALPAYPEVWRSTIQISTAPADRSSAT